MNNKKLSLLLLTGAGLVAISGSALAQASRIYFAGYMGLNMNYESDFKESSTPRTGNFEYNNAPSFAGAIGLRLDKKWRVEGEVSYHESDFNRVDFTGPGPADLGGSLTTWLYMANVYYDFDLGWDHLQPFVGAGLGVAYHEGEIVQPSGLAPDATGNSLGVAWQVGGGLKLRMKDNLAFTGGYRFVGTTDAQFGNYDFGYRSHEFRLGIEYDIPVDLFK